jgi:hypothetical protein
MYRCSRMRDRLPLHMLLLHTQGGAWFGFGSGFGRVCCLLVLNSVTSTLQWIRQPEAAWGCVWCLCKYVLGHSRVSQPLNLWLCLLRHFGCLTSPHASPTCRRRRLNSYRLLRCSTPGPPPNLRAHLLHLPSSPRPPLYTQTITT